MFLFVFLYSYRIYNIIVIRYRRYKKPNIQVIALLDNTKKIKYYILLHIICVQYKYYNELHNNIQVHV